MSNQTDQRLSHFSEVLEQRRIVRAAWEEWSRQKEISAAKKKKWEAEQSQLDVLLDEDPDQQRLFTTPLAVPPSEPEPEIVQDNWRDLDVNQLQDHGITESQCEKLSAAGIDTLGALQDLMQRNGQFWAKDLKGIGEQKAEKIADAMNVIVIASSDDDDDEEEGELVDASFKVVQDYPGDEDENGGDLDDI